MKRLWNYLTANPLVMGLVGLALVLIIVGAFSLWRDRLDKHDEVLVNSGELIERSRGNEEVLNHVEAAKDATSNPTAADVQRVCDKYDRNCQNGK